MTSTPAPLEKMYDEYLVKTYADKIEIFLEDKTNPIVVLPLKFATQMAADLAIHTPGSIDIVEAPQGGALLLTTALIPAGIAIAEPVDNIYDCKEIKDNDVFAGIVLHVTGVLGVNNTNVDVRIDGVVNGAMHFSTDHRVYVPGTPVVFPIGHHVLAATFIDAGAGTHSTTLEIHFMTVPH